MFEIKLIKAGGRLYRWLISLGLYSINQRDKRALKRLDFSLGVSDDYAKLATNIVKRAVAIEAQAHIDYDNKARQINSAYNTLQNLRDDLPKID